ncbi:MAG: hypothetical protein K2X68_01210, partial [Novosphingobium sp.]|nr:hypothetical protein [Novosphingobium sp.]
EALPPLRSAREFWSEEAAQTEPTVLPPGTSEDPDKGVFFTRPTPSSGVPGSDGDGGGAMIALPRRRTRKSLGRRIWFGASFVAPVVLGALYLFLLAPDQYTTEFRFSVRVPVGQPGSMASSGASLSALFGGNPTPGTDLLDNFTVADYVRSQQAAVDLDKKVNLKAMYNKPGDPLSRVGDTASAEKLARYWKKMVFSDYDVTTGLAIVRVKAYTAQDSYTIANSLLQQSNELVNQIGQQSQQDTVRFAQQQVERASQQLTDLRRQISSLSAQDKAIERAGLTFRTNTDLAVTTRNNIVQLQAQIQALMAQLHNPNAPQIRVLREQLAANESALASSVDVANAPQSNRYADLIAQLPPTLQVLSNAQAAYSNARAQSDAQRLYLTTYVKPRLAESPSAPDRLAELLLLTVIVGMVWMVGLLVSNSVMEHGR